MASIQSTGPHQHRVRIRRNGRYASRTFETRREAEEWARVTEGRVTGGEVIERKTVVSLAEACTWMRDHIADTPNAKNVRAKLDYWEQSKFSSWSLSAVHDWDLIGWRDEVLEAGDGNEQTCIHRLNILSKLVQTWSRAHRVAIDNPVKPGVRPGKPDGRSRRLSRDEESRLLEAADRTSRPWLRPNIVIALETAMRQGEQHGLTWDAVKLESRFVDLLKTKNDRARRVPLSVRAVEAFRELQVFPKPVPVETTRGMVAAFETARALCGMDDLHWHDLRHEATCKFFEESDLRDHEVMAITGHLTPAMLSRYTHLRADRLIDRLPGGDRNPLQTSRDRQVLARIETADGRPQKAS
jgi:integrase